MVKITLKNVGEIQKGDVMYIVVSILFSFLDRLNRLVYCFFRLFVGDEYNREALFRDA